MPGAMVTVKGGLPVWAEVSFSYSDGPDGRDDWAEVDGLYWLKGHGKGKPVTVKFMAMVEKYDRYWEANVTEQVSEALAAEDYDRREHTFD